MTTSAATPPSEAPRRCAELVKCQVRGSTDLWMPCLLPAGHDGGCDPWVNYTTAPPLLLCEASALMAADTPTTSAACCLVHQLGKCDAVFTCCDRCPTFFADRAKPIYGKPFHGWSCDCDECKGYDERGEPRPGEAPRPQASAALPMHPHEIYSAWLGRLPFWTAVSNAWPLHLLNASEDEKDAWVLDRWKEHYVANA